MCVHLYGVTLNTSLTVQLPKIEDEEAQSQNDFALFSHLIQNIS